LEDKLVEREGEELEHRGIFTELEKRRSVGTRIRKKKKKFGNK